LRNQNKFNLHISLLWEKEKLERLDTFGGNSFKRIRRSNSIPKLTVIKDTMSVGKNTGEIINLEVEPKEDKRFANQDSKDIQIFENRDKVDLLRRLKHNQPMRIIWRQ
jgi:hypothetical protein